MSAGHKPSSKNHPREVSQRQAGSEARNSDGRRGKRTLDHMAKRRTPAPSDVDSKQLATDYVALGTTLALILVLQDLIRAVAFDEQKVANAIRHNADAQLSAVFLKSPATAKDTITCIKSARAVLAKIVEPFPAKESA